MKISVITTTYNSAKTLRDTFDSVLGQNYNNLDYIVVDGGSTDGTIEIIKEYEVLFDGRMRWMSEKDKGIYDAMNKGILMSSGDVVGILNSDDLFTSGDILNTIAKLFSSSQAIGIDAIYGDIHFVKPSNLSICVRYYSSRQFRPWLMRFGYMPAHPSFYVRRNVYEKYGLYSLEYKLASDYDMMVRLFCKYHIKAHYISKDFVTMRTGGASTSSFAHRMLLTKEDSRACLKYGIYSNFVMCSIKYFTKIFEFLTNNMKESTFKSVNLWFHS